MYLLFTINSHIVIEDKVSVVNCPSSKVTFAGSCSVVGWYMAVVTISVVEVVVELVVVVGPGVVKLFPVPIT